MGSDELLKGTVHPVGVPAFWSWLASGRGRLALRQGPLAPEMPRLAPAPR